MQKFNRCLALAGMAAGLVGVVPLAAQQQDTPRIESTWRHDRSGLTMTETHAGFTRGESRQFDEEGYNTGIKFTEDESGSWADLFIYRAAPASVAIWGDRAVSGMFANPALGEVDVAQVRIHRFTPPGGAGENSGLMVVTPLKGELSATGLSIHVHDGWLVKLRMSSRRLDTAALEARMAQFVEQLALPPAQSPAPPLADIADCSSPLTVKKKAKLMRLDMMGTIMLGATLGAVHEKRAEEATRAPAEAEPQWCRDAASQPQYGIYRRGGDDDSYLIALGDTGTSLSVGRYDLGPLMKPSRGFLVTQSDGVTERIYPPFDRLPQPEQALGLPGNVGPVTSIGLVSGSEGKQTIMVPSN